MNNIFILLAAGKGKRFGSKIPKQYTIYRNKMLFEHSVNKAEQSNLFKKIILVINNKKHISKKFSKNVVFINGGKERSDSSLIGLKYIKKFKPTNVLIHDAARPNFSTRLLKNLVKSLGKNVAVIPKIKTNDSIKYRVNKKLFNLNRNDSFLTQTPQAFKFNDLYSLSIKQKAKIQDEATLFIENNLKIKFIKGENANSKITYKEDIKINKTFVGIGFDIHRLVKGKKLYLAGLEIPFHSGLKGHSDGDVIIHSVIDALLGAMRKKDIGNIFPDNIKKFKNLRSIKMLKPIVLMLNKSNFYINNIDINLICEHPKVSKYRYKLIKSLSSLMNIDSSLINLKGKTVEKLGLIGKEKAIACESIVSIIKYD